MYLVLCRTAICIVQIEMDLVSFRAEKYIVCNS
jgi:hypothetical protein